MAYLALITGPFIKPLSGNGKLATFTIIETDVAAGDEWGSGGVNGTLNGPEGCSLWFNECELTDADLATSVQNELRTAAAAGADALDLVHAEPAAANPIQSKPDARVRVGEDGHSYFGKSNVNLHANEVTTHLTFLVQGS